MGKLKIQQTNSVTTSQLHDRYASPITINGNHIGGVGGNTNQSAPTIQPTVKL